MPSQSPTVLLAQLAVMHQQQRFYQLRFMWVVIQALDKLGVPTRETDELRGLYTAFAEGVPFSSAVGKQKEADDTASPSS